MIECRSGDCDDAATYRAVLRMPRSPGNSPKPWEGEFCHKHLMRVLNLKIEELFYQCTLTITRIY